MPGVTRNGKEQTLIATNIGRRDWGEWMDFVEGISDELPSLTYLADALRNPIILPEELIGGLLRVGHKMIVSGSSKAGKSFLLIELALGLACGSSWLGFKCKSSRVLYVNLEIDKASCINRFKTIMDAKSIDVKYADNITIWNLRGNALPMDQLVPKLIRRIKNQNYSAVIIDPIYKVITGDENNASDMGKFCNYFDKICLETGCSTIYCHHHSKGTQGQKKAQDRGSGSGVFARDPDAIIDLIQLDTTPDFILKYAATVNSTAWRVEGSLREFPNFKPVNCWFNYPIHEIDTKGVLSSTFVEGSRDANLSKSGKRKQTKETRKEELDDAFTAVCMGKKSCQIEELAEYMGLSERTIQARLQEFSEDYISKKKEVHKL
ncbi:MAG: AAA family ATPase [Bacilli bacterium]|nr:AAA family ATPase [Bacilli bacterium]